MPHPIESRRPRAVAGLAVVLVLSAVSARTQTQTQAQTQNQAAAPPAPQFRTGVDIVLVEATVLGRDGAIFEGLGPGDFKVELEGRAREIAAVELVRHASAGLDPRTLDPDISTNVQAAAGRTILLVIDHASLQVESHGMIEAASRWVGTLAASDRVGVIVLPPPGLNIEFTTDHARIREALAKVRPLAKAPQPFSYRTVSPWEAIRITEDDRFIREQVTNRECRGEPACPGEILMVARSMKLDAEAAVTPLLRSLRAVMKALGVLPGPKHAVLLSSGWLMTERDAALEIATVAADAAVSNVTIHTFTSEALAPTASQRRPSPTPGQDRNLLASTVEMVSGMTGGRAVRLTGKGDLAFDSLTAGLGGYYRLAVRARPDDLDGKPHRISVEVTRAGAKLAGHRRILAATAKPAATPVDATKALQSALDSPTPLGGLDLRATSYTLHGTDAASRALRVVVTGDVARGSPGPATVVAALYTLDGQPVTAVEKPVVVPAQGPAPILLSLTAPPGAYTLRLAVRDVDGHLGSLERFVDARWKKAGPVETPGLLLMRASADAGASPQPVFQQVTTADHLIAQLALSGGAREKLQVQFDVVPDGAGAPLLQRAGRLGTASGGTTVAEIVLAPSALPPGRYTLRASVRPGDGPPFTRSFQVTPAGAPSARTP